MCACRVLHKYCVYNNMYTLLLCSQSTPSDQHTLGSIYTIVACVCVCVCVGWKWIRKTICATRASIRGAVRRGSEEFPAPVSGLLLVKTNDSRTRQTRSRIYIYVSILTPRLWLPRRQMTDITLHIYIYTHGASGRFHGVGRGKGWWLSWTLRDDVRVRVCGSGPKTFAGYAYMRIVILLYRRNNNIILYNIVRWAWARA